MSNQTKIALSGIALLILAIALILLVILPPQDQPRSTSQSSASTPTQITLANTLPTSAPTSKTSPTSTIYASPTKTCTANTLAELVSESEGIAEVTVTHVYTIGNNDSAVVRVDKWIKVLSISHILPPNTVNQPYLLIGSFHNNSYQIETARRYIIFIDEGQRSGDCHPRGFGLLEEESGTYRIDSGVITQAGLPQYNGIPLPQFEELLSNELPASTRAELQPTVMPDVGQDDLMRLAQSADLILEVKPNSGDAYGQFYDVLNVLKKPADITVPEAVPGGLLSVRSIRCGEYTYGAGAGGRHILFVSLPAYLKSPTPTTTRDHYVNKDNILLGSFTVDSTNTIERESYTFIQYGNEDIQTDDSLNHYAGWSYADLKTAITNAINAPYILSTPIFPLP